MNLSNQTLHDPTHVLTLSCANQPGIVAAVAGLLFNAGGDIVDAQQFDDIDTDQFFMRVVFRFVAGRDAARAEARAEACATTNADSHSPERSAAGADAPAEVPVTDLAASPPAAVRAAFAPLAQRFAMQWQMRARAQRRRVLIMVSNSDHCLVDLLYRWRNGELPMDIVAVVSNHPRESFQHVSFGDIAFHHLPVTRQTKLEQETRIWALVRETESDLVVLARYMQILSDGLAAKLSGRCINIHHSFLPGFKGAKPYAQAHARGVKLIGATAHYVTSDLDEGPIIEQNVERVSHRDRPEDLARRGRDIERQVLARAVRLHLEDRVLINGTRTVIFND